MLNGNIYKPPSLVEDGGLFQGPVRLPIRQAEDLALGTIGILEYYWLTWLARVA